MKLKKIALLVLLVSTLTFGSTIFMTEAKVKPIDPPDLDPNNGILQIVTRHDSTIQGVFRDRFLAHPLAINNGITALEFSAAGSAEGFKKLMENEAKGIDIAWGGGPALFNTLENWDLLLHIDNTTLINFINTKVPDQIAGADMKLNDTSGNLIWVANAISSFGFTINHDYLSTRGLPIPTTWEELASPVYYLGEGAKAISMGDPPGTTSNTRIYQIILQAFGWEEGWSILTRMGANSGIYPGSVATRQAVVDGNVGIAMTIDFYGTIASGENPDCEYIIPEGQSIVNGDPIAIAANTDNRAKAEIFLQYLFEEEGGQTDWMRPGLERLPVNELAFTTTYGSTRTDIYKLFNDTLVNEGIDFNETEATANLKSCIYYFHNTISDSHTQLRETWGEMISQLDEGTITQTDFDELVDRLGEVGMTYEESFTVNIEFDDSLKASEYEEEWKTFAQQKYSSIICDLGGPCEKTDFQLTPILVSTIFIAALTVIYRKKRK
jgi:ABC-type Fe3+ transport system substrate-binding protein